jgi:hypothetical protein
MPVSRLGRVTSPRHAILAVFNREGVSHVGLLAAPAEVDGGAKALTNHMGPPLALPGEMLAHAVGWLDTWTEQDCIVLDVWLRELETQISIDPQSVTYVAAPSVVRDEGGTERPVSLKFSCAGFVAEAYREGVGVRLVVDDAELPEVDRATLERVWDPRTVRIGARYGLGGDGPWRVLLPGYLLRAVTRPRVELPFRPMTPADAELPASPAAESL